MIAKLCGSLLEKSPTRILIEVGGIGYEVHIPLSTFDKLGEVGERISLFTHLHVRDDALQLFGFATAREKELFQHLLSVTGIGPKLAQSILSGCAAEVFYRQIVQNDIAALTAIPGVGKKTAERLVVELRDRLARWVPEASEATPQATISTIQEESIMALISLGYSRAAAQKAVERAAGENGEQPVEQLIKRALQYIK
ncbi:MAG: Holliday junction branch migration protein RuvA [candidate division KSB1 bacterium]|nr:Holliday junction branch migration protein RuvA [candidate division KSB1 bacterium]